MNIKGWYEATANTFANSILSEASSLINVLTDLQPNTTHEEKFRWYVASVAFYYVCVDKQASGMVKSIKPDEFADLIVKRTLAICAKEAKLDSPTLNKLMNGVNTVIAELAPYTNHFLPASDEDFGGTLLWEFMKSLGLDTQSEPVVYQHIASRFLVIMGAVKKLLDLQDRLNRL